MLRTIKLFALSELAVLALWFYSFEFFLNFQIAFLASIIIMLGSLYSYKRLVDRRVESEDRPDDTDLVDKLDDPFDLYSEDIKSEALVDEEEIDLQTVVKEERARLKSQKNTLKNTAKSAPALVSIFRVVPYLFLVLGFIGLKNNNLLSIPPFLIGLGVGIVVGLYVGRGIFIEETTE